MKVYTPENMRSADTFAIEVLGIPGTVLMDRAADALLEALTPFTGKEKKFVILCGKGNNGGDGYALAGKLSAMFEKTVCISLFGEPQSSDAINFHGLCRKKAESTLPLSMLDASKDYALCVSEIKNADVIVDAIFGTGFSGEIEDGGICAQLLSLSNSTGCVRLSADIPSGACAATGRVSENTFRADITITFAKVKVGMFSYPAREYCGDIRIADIGIPESVFEAFESKYEISDADTVKEYMPKRFANSNKGSYGKTLIYAGSGNMTGAAHLACMGALRLGTGLVCMASEPDVLDILKCRISEPVFYPVADSDADTDSLIGYANRCSAVLIGCGLGSGENVKKRVCRMIRECNVPIILDADGINAISDNINILSEAKRGIVLTPHPLEFSRISEYSLSEICENRIECAQKFSEKYGCTLLLKGAGTVICEKGARLCINTSGNSALSKGGSGDVLAGMITSLVSQGASLYESAVCAAYLHGAAADRLSVSLSQYGVLPSEIPEYTAKVLADIMR